MKRLFLCPPTHCKLQVYISHWWSPGWIQQSRSVSETLILHRILFEPHHFVFNHFVLFVSSASPFPLTIHLLLQASDRACLMQLKYFYPTLGVCASDGRLRCGVLLEPDPRGILHRWEAINMNLWHQAYSWTPAFSLHLVPASPKHKNIMNTNNSEENEINEGYNCVWNCNYFYHSLLSQGFSVSRCANEKDCHCLCGLNQPHCELPALLTPSYWFLLTIHRWWWEKNSLSRGAITHLASG